MDVKTNVGKAEVSQFTIAVVGGGLHGISIASEAASRGLSVVLIQSNDLANGPTGSMRSVLRGGLRKLENLQLTTVNQNWFEIALLKSKAPHLLKLQKFNIHENTKVRSNSRIQQGLKIYRYIQQRQLRKRKIIENFDKNEEGLFYYDYQLSNARLILSIAQQAQRLGASIRPYHKVLAAERGQNAWQLEIEHSQTKETYPLCANILVNCCGWLASSFLKDILNVPTRCGAKISHHLHLVLLKPHGFSEGNVFQLEGGKLLYAHSLDERRFILGPIIVSENTEHAKNAAIESAVQVWNSATSTSITFADIEHSWWSSRAKPEDPLSNDNGIFRECLLDLNNPGKVAPLLNSFGMNTVQHRLIAEQAIEILQPFTKAKKNSHFSTQALPGGDFSQNMSLFRQEYKDKAPAPLHSNIDRLIENYGSASKILIEKLIDGSQGHAFGYGLHEAEVRYLIDNEWARCADDILWRRTKLGLVFSEREAHELNGWIFEHS